MSWCADVRVFWVALWVAALVFGPGCYEWHPCGDVELCNWADDDCDGLVDEGLIDEEGRYVTIEHCGSCGVACAAVFPTASVTACEIVEDVPTCVLVECPPGTHLGGEGACVPDVLSLCLACRADADCALREVGAVCRPTIDEEGGRCAPPCDTSGEGPPCPPATECVDGACWPIGGDCTCNAATLGLEIACLIDRGDGHSCAGVQVCAEDGFTECAPALTEACNETDDDCDSEIDEDFRDEEGRYVDRLNCGGCAIPCVEPGPNMIASCLPDGAGVRCEVVCAENFVDVDGIQANGCECERWDGMGPPPAIGGDADCDGIPDDTDDFIYVTATGSDTNPGTLARPVRTLARGASLGRTQGKDVLVARGVYEGPFALVAGVGVFGGYRPDFRDRDLELYPVLLEARGDGEPVVTCAGITATTRFEGFTLAASDATEPGGGSTALYSDVCGPNVAFAAITILAARGADGVRGDDSSDNLADWGLSSLSQLDGENGTDGRPAPGSGCPRIAGGVGGSHTCRAVDVSGGVGGAASCPASGCVNGSPCGNAGCTDFTVGGVCDIEAALRIASPNPAAGAGRGPGAGAAGELTYNAPTNRGLCNFCDDNPTLPRNGGIGGDGGDGGDGTGGLGCSGAPLLDARAGILRAGPGTNGTTGTDGSGGGGATAGSGYDVISGTTGGPCEDRSGGSGGGGGSGGCGAPGADAGSGGGSSAGIIVRLVGGSRGPSFEDVRVVTASGGRGGDGGVGASGGAAGRGGLGGPTSFWCSRTGGRGGDGGRGGAGGGGGGGCGGGSYGAVVVGGTDVFGYVGELGAALDIDPVGVAGSGGSGGFSPAGAGTDGRDGDRQTVISLP